MTLTTLTNDDGAMTHSEINYRLPSSHIYFLTSSTTTLVSHASEIKNATSASSLTSSPLAWKSHRFLLYAWKFSSWDKKKATRRARWGASSTFEKMKIKKIYRNELGLTCCLCGQVWSAIIFSFLRVNYSCFLHLNKDETISHRHITSSYLIPLLWSRKRFISQQIYIVDSLFENHFNFQAKIHLKRFNIYTAWHKHKHVH